MEKGKTPSKEDRESGTMLKRRRCVLERGDPNIRSHITPTEYFKGFSEIPIVIAALRKPLNRILEVGRTDRTGDSEHSTNFPEY